MLVSGFTSLGLVCLLVALTWKRTWWIGLLDWEAGLWKRMGVSDRWLLSLRRIEESRWLVPAVAFLTVLHIGLCAFAGGAYLHYRKKLQERPAAKAPMPVPRSVSRPAHRP